MRLWKSAQPLHLKIHEMTFWEHVEELRRAIIGSLLALAVTAGGSWFVSGRVLDLIVRRNLLVGRAPVPAVFLSPAEALGARVKVALTLGVLLALPVILFRLWRFIGPGLLRTERSLIAPLVAFSVTFFYLGTAFGFFLLVPGMMRVLLAFGTDYIKPQLAIGNVLGFVFGMSLACGAVFQLPLVVAVLSYVGLVTPRMLLKRWREAVVIIFIASAFITPGDTATSTLMLGLPVTALYFISVGLSFFVRRRKRLREEEEAADAARD